MEKDPRCWTSISGKMVGGTATPVTLPSVIPKDKAEKEVFWVSQLISLIPEYRAQDIVSNEDDSEGNHDVLVNLIGAETIGVQVTELTSELQKARSSLSAYHTKNIVNKLKEVNAISNDNIVVNINLKGVERKKPKFPKPVEIARIIKEKSLKGFSESPEVDDRESFRLTFQPMDTGELFVPSHKKIGVSVNYDALPRTLEMYENAIEYLVKKKSNSKSPWLVIWSSTFWKDRHWLEEEILIYMKHIFSNSCFENVYFIESMDGKPMFEANIHWHQIK